MVVSHFKKERTLKAVSLAPVHRNREVLLMSGPGAKGNLALIFQTPAVFPTLGMYVRCCCFCVSSSHCHVQQPHE